MKGGLNVSGEPKLITARELAEKLELSVETIWRYTRENKIPYIELGNRQYRYVMDDVMASLSQEEPESGAMVREDAAHCYSTDRIYTYSDYLQLSDAGNYHYEILDGELVKAPTPTTLHQRVSYKLQYLLLHYFWERDPKAEVFSSPIDLTLSETNVLQPDLVYVPGDSNIVEEQRINGIPELVVEIMSPSTQRKDRLSKLRIYFKAGIPHYWLVDPEVQTIEAFALLDTGEYAVRSGAEGSEAFTHTDFPGLTIELGTLWKKGSL